MNVRTKHPVRRILAVIAALALLAPSALGQQEPQQGGTLSMAVISSPLSYPLLQRTNLSDVLYQKLLFDGLVRYSLEDLSPAPSLAESWDVSDDGTVYTFNLREGVTWHDGEAFDASDVKFTMDLVLDADIPSSAGAYYRSAVREVVVVDDMTVEFRLTGPVTSFLTQLGYNFFMLPEHVLSQYETADLVEATEFSSSPIGTGGFMHDENRPGEFARVVRNPQYWDGAPHLDAVVLSVVPDSNTQVAQVLSGTLDFAAITEPQVAGLENNPNVTIRFVPQVNYHYFALNLDNPLFQDVRVRQAMMYALDRESILEVALLGQGSVAHHAINPLLEAYNDDVQKYPFDPERAEALLDEAGWIRGADGVRVKDGQRFEFELLVDRGNVSREQEALIAQENWSAVGLAPIYQFGEFASVVSRYREGDYVTRITYWITPPTVDVYNYWHSNGSSNFTNYGNPELDDLLERGRVTPDPAARKEIYDRVQEILAEDVPTIWVAYPTEPQALRANVNGFPEIGYRDAMPYLNRVWKE